MMIRRIIKIPIGAGDAVAFAAKPIAVVSDAVLGTNFKGCGGCGKRREDLNQAIPNINPFAKNEFAKGMQSALPDHKPQ